MGQSWVYPKFFSIFGNFWPNFPIFWKYSGVEMQYNLLFPFNFNWYDYFNKNTALFTIYRVKFCNFRGFQRCWKRGVQFRGASRALILGILAAVPPGVLKIFIFYEKIYFKNPKNHTSRKISVFSFKEIDRSSLLEDFLRKSEIVYSGDFWYSEEKKGDFVRGLTLSTEFFYSLIFYSSSCALWMKHSPHSPKISWESQ